MQHIQNGYSGLKLLVLLNLDRLIWPSTIFAGLSAAAYLAGA